MDEKRRITRGLWIIVFVAIGLGALGSAGWYWAAGKLDEQVARLKSNEAERGRQIECVNQEIKGYPFRLGIFCDTFSYEDKSENLSVNGGAVRSAAQVYAPHKIITEVDGPISLASRAGSASLDWESARSSMAIGLNGPKRFSARALKVAATMPDGKDVSVGEAQLHTREAEAAAMDVAFSAFQLELGQQAGRQIPVLNLEGDATVNRLADALRKRRNLPDWIAENGVEGLVRNLKLALPQSGTIAVSGPFRISRAGKLTGQFKFITTDFDDLSMEIEKVFPETSRAMGQIKLAVSALGAAQGNGAASLSLDVREGKVFLGLFPIGEVPDLF